jgi:hypothetical protein
VVATRFGVIQGKISGVIMGLQIMQDSEESKKELMGSNKFLLQTIKLLDEAINEISNLGRQLDEA